MHFPSSSLRNRTAIPLSGHLCFSLSELMRFAELSPVCIFCYQPLLNVCHVSEYSMALHFFSLYLIHFQGLMRCCFPSFVFLHPQNMESYILRIFLFKYTNMSYVINVIKFIVNPHLYSVPK